MGQINVYEFETEQMVRNLVKHELAGSFYSYVYLLRQKKVSQYLIEIVSKDSGMKKEQIITTLEKWGIKIRKKK